LRSFGKRIQDTENGFNRNVKSPISDSSHAVSAEIDWRRPEIMAPAARLEADAVAPFSAGPAAERRKPRFAGR